MRFIFDLDGTVCFKGQPISNRIRHSLSELTETGIEVIFASARPIRNMLPVIDETFYHYTMIGGNGSLISKEGKVIKVYVNKHSNENVLDISPSGINGLILRLGSFFSYSIIGRNSGIRIALFFNK